MDLINGINMYAMRGAQIRKELKETLGITTEQKTEIRVKTNNLNPKDVLSFMANQSISLKPDVSKTINVSNFVNTEQYKRIGNMMKEFEASVESGLQTFNGEFPNLQISESSKLTTVLNALEKNRL